MFTAALFTIARTLKQTKCLLTDEWINKMWYTYRVDYYSAIIKEQNHAMCSDMDRKIVILSEISQRKINIIWYC